MNIHDRAIAIVERLDGALIPRNRAALTISDQAVKGLEKYGEPLTAQSKNSDSESDCQEELADALCYLLQVEEREALGVHASLENLRTIRILATLIASRTENMISRTLDRIAEKCEK